MKVHRTISSTNRWIIGGAVAAVFGLAASAAQAAAPVATAKTGIVSNGGKAPMMRLNPQPLPPRW